MHSCVHGVMLTALSQLLIAKQLILTVTLKHTLDYKSSIYWQAHVAVHVITAAVDANCCYACGLHWLYDVLHVRWRSKQRAVAIIQATL
jgi:hypothetical protein